MNWFELDADALSYHNLMGASRAGERLLSASEMNSFSELGWYYYVVAILVLLILGWVVFRIAKGLALNIGSYWKISSVLLSVLAVYSAFFIILLWEVPFTEIPGQLREGTFGDSFGTLNTLFSGFAFSGVLISLLFQRKDLTETRRQITRQQIESQFYSMLSLQHSVVAEFDLKKDGAVTMAGRDCFKTWYNYLRKCYLERLRNHDGGVEEAYEDVWVRYRGDLSLYFRSLYSVFRYVSECDHSDKLKFGVIARSFLSDFELVILFYNCLSLRGYGFQKYAEEFAIFNNLDPMMLMEVSHLALMEESVYGRSNEMRQWRSFLLESEEIH
ncbi:putative phage abortive infection protein [Pseudomonas sp. Je.1.5.c]|uniref:putative phage abortive infection protein n=1 Tax=Pseudomonas sp. Je.1.5.c TaxID=3142839 RepID=UPI003DA80478